MACPALACAIACVSTAARRAATAATRRACPRTITRSAAASKAGGTGRVVPPWMESRGEEEESVGVTAVGAELAGGDRKAGGDDRVTRQMGVAGDKQGELEDEEVSRSTGSSSEMSEWSSLSSAASPPASATAEKVTVRSAPAMPSQPPPLLFPLAASTLSPALSLALPVAVLQGLSGSSSELDVSEDEGDELDEVVGRSGDGERARADSRWRLRLALAEPHDVTSTAGMASAEVAAARGEAGRFGLARLRMSESSLLREDPGGVTVPLVVGGAAIGAGGAVSGSRMRSRHHSKRAPASQSTKASGSKPGGRGGTAAQARAGGSIPAKAAPVVAGSEPLVPEGGGGGEGGGTRWRRAAREAGKVGCIMAAWWRNSAAVERNAYSARGGTTAEHRDEAKKGKTPIAVRDSAPQQGQHSGLAHGRTWASTRMRSHGTASSGYHLGSIAGAAAAPLADRAIPFVPAVAAAAGELASAAMAAPVGVATAVSAEGEGGECDAEALVVAAASEGRTDGRSG